MPCNPIPYILKDKNEVMIMNRTCMRTTIIWMLAALCSLTLSITVWADEVSQANGSAPETVSQVVVSGAAAAREAEEKAAMQNTDGPGTISTAIKTETTDGKKGVSLGIFTTTGYCSDERCGDGSGQTYSGAVPQANHTLSADLSRFPIGTKLMINDIIYTVEDMGSSVKGDWVDIFYDTYEEALAHGMKKEEVFTVIEE